MTNIPVSSIELRNETSTLKSISGDSVTVLEYSIDLVKDNLQGQRLTCVAVGDDTVYTETAVVTVKGMSSKKMCDNFQINFSPAPSDPLVTVPSGSPVGFTTVYTGEREVVFSWSSPPVTERNGVITSYTLSCSPSPSSLPQSPSSGPLTVAGFSPHTSYSCSLVASNTQGSGPPAPTSFTTLQDCEPCKFTNCLKLIVMSFSDSFIQLRFGGVLTTCAEEVVSQNFIHWNTSM